MSQTHPMTRLEVVNVETLEVTKAVYMTTQDPKQIQAMSDSLLRNLNTFQFFVRSAPSAGPVAAVANKVGVDMDAGFLQWIHDRMRFVHGEDENVDYMHKLRAIIAAVAADRNTPNVASIATPVAPATTPGD